MKTILTAALLLASFTLQAQVKLGALVHEQFMTKVGDQGLGAQGGMIIGRRISDAGMTELTASLRMTVKGQYGDYVYLHPLRTPTADLERFLVRAHHAHSKTALRPVLVKDTGVMLADRVGSPSPMNLDVFFDTYFSAIYGFATSADKFDISEFVLATGMGKLWSAQNASRWINLQGKISRRLNGVPLALEIASHEDLLAVEKWKNDSPTTFKTFFDKIKTIRYQINDRFPGDLASWKKAALTGGIEAGMDKIRGLFPQHKIRLVNITVPACDFFNLDNETYECFEGNWNHNAQKLALGELMDAFNNLQPKHVVNLISVEFNTGVSEFEPEGAKKDSRFINYIPDFQTFFKSLKTRGPLWNPPILSEISKSMPAIGEKNACVYYNGAIENGSPMGEIHGQLLVNLIGAFPSWNPQMRDMKHYKAGDLNNCEVGFYIATNYFYDPSPFFLTELAHFLQKKTFVWFNYKLDFFQQSYRDLQEKDKLQPMEFVYKKIVKPEVAFTPNNLNMGFYRYFEYKGEEFYKLAKWNFNTNAFMADPEIGLVQLEDNHPNTKVLSWARHSTDNSKVPYVTHQKFQKGGNIYYFGDTPFSFVHYEDRYMILTDLMWDIMGEKAPTELRALARLEDIDGMAEPENLRWAFDYLADNNIPFSIATIPIYSNVFGNETGNMIEPQWTPIGRFPGVGGMLKYAKSRGADFVFHGVAHQGGDHLCGYDGNSGDDFEFWMYPENTPMPDDSVEYVTSLLDQGEKAFQELGITPAAWETPHYANSALDSVIFGRTFSWSYHRSIYFPIKKIFYPKRDESLHYFTCKTSDCKEKQKEYLNKIRISVDESTFSGQIFPYPVYRDVYGQRIIPETLGFVDHIDYPADTWRDVTSHEDIVRRARKLRVIRGAIASFFWHPHMLSPGAAAQYNMDPSLYYRMDHGRGILRYIIEEMTEMGYKFVSISDPKIFPQSFPGVY